MDCNVQGSPEAKKPCKGILKTSSSFDKHSVSQRRKSTKFDELNVLQTYHPPDKDYGHMKIEEPKTPYNYVDPDEQSVDQLDADLLAERLQMTEPRKSLSSADDDSSEEEYSHETEEQRQKRLEFEKRRKLHYNEFEAIKLARKLIEEEDDDDDGGEGNSQNNVDAESAERSDQASVSLNDDGLANDAGEEDKVSSTVANEIDMDNENS